MDTTESFSDFFDNDPCGITRQITVFPTTVDFHPTFPHVPANFTVLIANPYHYPQAVNISFNGDKCFSTSSPQYVIQPGEVRSCVVIFNPKSPGKFKTMMKVTSDDNDPCIVSIQANCFPSPLVFPFEEIQSFEFNDISTEFTFTLHNKSIIDTIHVVITPNSSSFSITNPSIELKPKESADVTLLFNPRNIETNLHTLNVQCTETGDSFDLELNVGRIRQTITVDLGNISVGKSVSKTISLPNAVQLTEIQPPFSISAEENNLNSTEVSINEDPKMDVTVKYCSKEEGAHMEFVEFEDFFLLLKGQSFVPFFSIDKSQKKDDITVLSNQTDQVQICKISFSENFENFTDIKLRPKQTYEVKMNKMSDLYVSWKKNDDLIIDHFELPKQDIPVTIIKETPTALSKKKSTIPITLNNDGDSPRHVTLQLDHSDFALDENYKTLVLPPHTMQSVNVTFTPTKSPKSKASLKLIDKSNVTKLSLECGLPLICDRPFIPFFGASKYEELQQTVTVTGANDIEIISPDFLKTEFDEETHKATIECGDIPESTVLTDITFSSESSASINVPVIAYRGASDLILTPPSPLEKRKGLLTTTIEVTNKGMRSGFVIFTGANDNKREIHASPSYAAIPAAKKMNFKFIVDEGEGEVKIEMHSGDEIMRQIRALLKPDSFYATQFADVKTRDEISLFRENKKVFDEKYFTKIFKSSLKKKIIVLPENENDSEAEILKEFNDEPTFSISETNVDFGNIQVKEERKSIITIENLSMKPTKVKLSHQSKDVHVPSLIKLKPSEQQQFTVDFVPQKSGKFTEEIQIQNEAETKIIKLSADVEEPMVQIDTLNFGTCAVGRLHRGKLQISNRKSSAVVIEAVVEQPFYLPIKTVEIEAGCFVKFPVHFIPNVIGPFQAKLEFKPDIAPPFSVILIGNGEK